MPDPGEKYIYVRLLTPLPLRVTFPTASFLLQLASITQGANRHSVEAHEFGTAKYHRIGPDYLDSEWRDQAAYRIGLKIRCATVSETIMRRLVRDGHAELMPTPADDLEYKPPRVSTPIWPKGWFGPGPGGGT